MADAHAALAEQFDDAQQQQEASTIGMWTFLATEIMFFGGLFLAYTIYRTQDEAAFAAASHELDLFWGTVNTAVLLTSSLTMALAVHAAQVGNRQRLVLCLGLTALLGAAFLGIKAYEYYVDYEERLVPWYNFENGDWRPGGEHNPGDHPVDPQKVRLFYMFYYIMTGIHAVHLVIGIGILLVLMALARRDWFSPLYYDPVEVGGLYWHFVDVIWIFLLPLLYLVASRAGGQ